MPTCPYCKIEFDLKGKRSNPQNRYYWAACVNLLSDHTGFNTDEIHEILKHKFLKKRMMLMTTIHDITKSTTELTTAEMEDYLSKVRQWASQELSVNIPEPSENSIDN